MDDNQDAQSLTCSASIRLQGGAEVSGDILPARVTAMACKPLRALQGDTVSQAWSSAPRIPCFTMHHETPAPPALSRKEMVRAAVFAVMNRRLGQLCVNPPSVFSRDLGIFQGYL